MMYLSETQINGLKHWGLIPGGGEFKGYVRYIFASLFLGLNESTF